MRFLTPKDLGALVREVRISARMTQAALGEKIGASRYWVAEFERGNAGAELGLTLKALRALELIATVESKEAVLRRGEGQRGVQEAAKRLNQPTVDLSSILSRSTTPIASGQRSEPFRVYSFGTTPRPEHTEAVRARKGSAKRRKRAR